MTLIAMKELPASVLEHELWGKAEAALFRRINRRTAMPPPKFSSLPLAPLRGPDIELLSAGSEVHCFRLKGFPL